MDRIADTFVWPVRDPRWPVKVLIIALTLLIPIVGVINGIGWMLAALDRLRAGDPTLPPGNLRYLGRGIRLFVVGVVYSLGVLIAGGLVYAPAVFVLAQEGRGPVNAGLVALGVILSVLAFGVVVVGFLALNFATPAIVLETERGGIAGGLRVGGVLRRCRGEVVNTLIAGLMLIAAGFVGSLGGLLCGVGVFITTAYSLAMQAWIVRSYEIG